LVAAVPTGHIERTQAELALVAEHHRLDHVAETTEHLVALSAEQGVEHGAASLGECQLITALGSISRTTIAVAPVTPAARLFCPGSNAERPNAFRHTYFKDNDRVALHLWKKPARGDAVTFGRDVLQPQRSFAA
jgi:hypothetical protein